MIIYLIKKKTPCHLFGKIQFYQNYITGSRDNSFPLVYNEKCKKVCGFCYIHQTQPYTTDGVTGLFTCQNVVGDNN